jgi:CHAT domain-containing protein
VTGLRPARVHLTGGALLVRELSHLDLAGARLAVLSACETVRATRRLADEVLPVASAMQLAGFRHVVGTLWAIPDGVAARFADAIYTGLGRFGIDDSARALHQAVSVLRDRYPTPPRHGRAICMWGRKPPHRRRSGGGADGRVTHRR